MTDWIAVARRINPAKIRRLRKILKCSEFEAKGLVLSLWQWASDSNVDDYGRVLWAELIDIGEYLEKENTDGRIKAKDIADALLQSGFLDEEIYGSIVIHDWQDYWKYYKQYQKRLSYDRENKRKNRAKKSAETNGGGSNEQMSLIDEKSEEHFQSDEPPKKEEEPKQKQPEKIKYEDFVSMTLDQYERLIKRYGERFTRACISELNNYKGASGKKYKSDYHAILKWVIESTEKKYPGLLDRSIAERNSQEKIEGNPFESFVRKE